MENNWEEYRDPKDLRDITTERLQHEGNQFGLQFNEWNNLFNIECAIRKTNSRDDLMPYDKISELLKWCILSNRFLLMDRENMTDYKLFTKDEVIRMIHMAYCSGWQDRKYSKEEHIDQFEAEKKYMNKVKNI